MNYWGTKMTPCDLARRHRFHRKRSLVKIEHHDFGHTVWDTKVDISRKHMKDFSCRPSITYPIGRKMLYHALWVNEDEAKIKSTLFFFFRKGTIPGPWLQQSSEISNINSILKVKKRLKSNYDFPKVSS